jgi:peptidoglycan/xylan/chitin deacetylase (PgdA/CDA1 family)
VTPGQCLVVMYHYVRDTSASPFPDIRALGPDRFAQQLDWLQAERTVVDLGRLTAALDGRATLPPRAALLTFDDGFVDHHDVVLPVLRDRGLTGTFFLTEDACERHDLLNVHKTQFLLAHLGAEAFGRAVLAETASLRVGLNGSAVFGADRWEHADERAVKNLLNYELSFEDASRTLDRLFRQHLGAPDAFARGLYLNAGQVRAMAEAGMTFGYHTKSHRMLSRLNPAEQEAELRSGPAWIRRWTGQQDVSFCYPWGGPGTYTMQTPELLRELGYSVAFNTVRRHVDTAVDGRYELPRLDTRDLPPHTSDETPAATAFPDEDRA